MLRVACSLSVALLLAGGCVSESGSASSGAERCGQTLCIGTTFCCDAECSVCATSQGFCREICVLGRCGGQNARARGDCRAELGVRWTGSACELLFGCECEGTMCHALYDSVEQCQEYNAECL